MPDSTEELDQEEDDSTESSVLDMSDEDFLNEPMPEELVAETEEVDDNIDNEEDDSEDVDDTSTDDVEEPEEEDDIDGSQLDASDDDTDTDDTSADDVEEEDTETQDTDTSTVDYKAEHEKLLGKFRANGKDMQVNSVDDALTLMKMGANYNKKMAGLKPNLKMLRMLENNNLLDESKLSYLIDLDKKNPEAIKKLIKDSGLDPLDVDLNKDSEYSPNTYTVDDKEVELGEALDEIRDSATFEDTVNIVSNKWDAKSKQILMENPAIISVIDEHVGSGIYDQINNIIESERMLGRLVGLSDLEAYKQVGDTLKANGAFNHQQQEKPPATVKKTKKVVDPKLKSRKKAAGSTKSTVSNKQKKEFNPLDMPDDEFEKIASSEFI